MNKRTLNAALLCGMLLMTAAACNKKAPVSPTPPPPPPAPAAAKVTPPPPPPPPPPKAQAARIDSFTVEPQTVQRGQPATLSWSVANATDISIDQGLGAIAANGTRQVFPSNTTTYSLMASSAGGSDMRSVTVNVTVPAPPPPPPPAPPKISGAEMLRNDSQDAFFDYNSSDVRDDARQALTRDAELLRRIFDADPTFTVVIEGHCDERGSAEFNLGLSDRRATSAKDYLVGLGLPAARIRTIPTVRTVRYARTPLRSVTSATARSSGGRPVGAGQYEGMQPYPMFSIERFEVRRI